jgi:retron-type reverse transcriptase
LKRHGKLYPELTTFANLFAASRQARRGKRYRDNVLAFEANLEAELLRLQAELQNKTYTPGAYRTFYIHEPKKRLISAAPYRDRVVHHALCNVIQPIFERTFIRDSYANRSGFGTHRALRRFTGFARTSRYVLQCDIQKYFPSIDHEILKTLLRRKIKCPDTLWLMDTLIDHSNPQEPVPFYFPGDDLFTPTQRSRGLPVGNLTSQFFANVYLNGFDHFVKQQLQIDRYVRYVDDFALFSDDKAILEAARPALEDYLAGLRLKIHPIKSQLFETRIGASFLGFRILPDTIRVRTENLRRARRRLHRLQRAYARGGIELDTVFRSLRSWLAHLQHGDTWRLREKLLAEFSFCRETVAK